MVNTVVSQGAVISPRVVSWWVGDLAAESDSLIAMKISG